MPEVIRVSRRPRQSKPAPLPVPHHKPWYKTNEDKPQLDSVDLNAIEYCVGCDEKMTATRFIVKLRDAQGALLRLGPCHPNCQELARTRYPRHKLAILPARIELPASA